MSSKGRGALFAKLAEQNADTSSSKDTTTVSDSGISCEGSRGASRGKLLEHLADTYSGLSISSERAGRGRAQLFENLKKEKTRLETESGPSHASSSNKTENVHMETASEETNKCLQIYKPKLIVGNKGTPVSLICNYIKIDADPTKGVFIYEVKFSPGIDSISLRGKLLNQHQNIIGNTRTFDGNLLYLPILLKKNVNTFISQHPNDGSNVEVRVTFTKKETLQNCIYLYNILFDKVMKILNFVRFNRKQFDPTAPLMIPHCKLEIWPGYVTAINEHDGGLMLCCDVSHRILNQKTVLESLIEISYCNSQRFHENAKKALLGAVVITRYNNRTYRIDDIDFDQTPQSKFKLNDENISYIEYYRKNYNIQVKDDKQPMIISIKKQRNAAPGAPNDILFCLVPELCHLTGLRDELRSDFKLMREIATFTHVSANQRYLALQKFYTNINNSPEAKQLLLSWGLKLRNAVENINGRQLKEEQIFFAKKQFSAGLNADFSKYTTSNEMMDVVDLNHWIVLHCKSDYKTAKSFTDIMLRNAPALGVIVIQPKIITLENDRVETYVQALRNNIKSETQMVVCICPSIREDRYSAIKRVCCSEIPIPSQVINARSLSNQSKNRSIVMKIALQMNCKLGGSLWAVNIPFKNVMICGIDSYHEANQRDNSVAAFVASLDSTYTRWYSKAIIQTKKEEIVNGLSVAFIDALEAYKQKNNHLPDSVIIYRDGVGDGQFPVVLNFEIPQFRSASENKYPGYKVDLTFIVVQKRINTKYLFKQGSEIKNCYPGTIVDHTITRKELFSFFLVSQSVKQGTASPTHYVVLHDDRKYEPDIIQRLTYKLTFLYYNWPGTIKSPAVCQYAHKLAYLVGQNIKRNPHEKLSQKLFYL